jgi:hypothetical protein
MEVIEILGNDTEVPVAVRNYKTERGWRLADITVAEEAAIQDEVRKRNNEVMAQALCDAERLLGAMGLTNSVTPGRVVKLAIFLAERRVAHVSRTYDEYLTRKIERERGRERHAGEIDEAEGDYPSAAE